MKKQLIAHPNKKSTGKKNPNKVYRKFSGSDIDMFTALRTLILLAIADQAILVLKRPKWTVAYLQTLLNKVETAIDDLTGTDDAQKQRSATKTVKGLSKNILDLLAELNGQIQNDFIKEPEDAKEIRRTLGFTEYYEDARKGNQEKLQALINQFRKQLSPEIKEQLIEKGILENTIDTIANYHIPLGNMVANQELEKKKKLKTTQEKTIELNDIYDDGINIVKNARVVLKDDKIRHVLYSYAATLKALHIKAKAEAEEGSKAKANPIQQ